MATTILLIIIIMTITCYVFIISVASSSWICTVRLDPDLAQGVDSSKCLVPRPHFLLAFAFLLKLYDIPTTSISTVPLLILVAILSTLAIPLAIVRGMDEMLGRVKIDDTTMPFDHRVR